MSEDVNTIAALWRFPVKSMRGAPIDSVEVASDGIVGDRAYALIDAQTNKVLSAKTPKLGPLLLSCEAVFVEPPRAGQEAPPVRITLGDGTTVSRRRTTRSTSTTPISRTSIPKGTAIP
jgi:hypothetical protein